MPRGKPTPTCPYCKKENNEFDVLGRSGLINYAGSHTTLICKSCGKYFEVETVVKISFNTKKESAE